MLLFQVPSLKTKIEKLDACTPGSALTRSSMRRYRPARRASSLYPAELASMPSRITFSRLKPVSTFVRFKRLRTKSPAVTSSTSESATCETTSAVASRPLAGALDCPRPSFSELASVCVVARNAGIVPNNKAVTTLTPSVNNSNRMSTPTLNWRASRPSNTMRDKRWLAQAANATPSAPPARASTRLSVRSCRISRERPAPALLPAREPARSIWPEEGLQYWRRRLTALTQPLPSGSLTVRRTRSAAAKTPSPSSSTPRESCPVLADSPGSAARREDHAGFAEKANCYQRLPRSWSHRASAEPSGAMTRTCCLGSRPTPVVFPSAWPEESRCLEFLPLSFRKTPAAQLRQ